MVPNNDKNRTYAVSYVPKVAGLHKVSPYDPPHSVHIPGSVCMEPSQLAPHSSLPSSPPLPLLGSILPLHPLSKEPLFPEKLTFGP